MNQENTREELLSYTFKQLLAKLANDMEHAASDIRDLKESMQQGFRDIENRVSKLEAGWQFGQDLIRRFIAVESSLQVLQQSLAVHEAADDQSRVGEEMSELKRDIKELRDFKTAISTLDGMRRWMWALSLGLAGSMASLLYALFHNSIR
jgi:uncharacterized membrane protein YccC